MKSLDQSGSKIVVAGSSFSNVNFDAIAVARFNIDSSFDNGYDTVGIVITPFGLSSNDYGFSVAIQSDGKIVVAWLSFDFDYYATAVLRYNKNCSLDNSFDTDGKHTTDLGVRDSGNSVAIQSYCKIVVAGIGFNCNYDDITAIRLTLKLIQV